MRAAWLLVALTGCGPVRLGEDPFAWELDGEVSRGLDAGTQAPSVFVAVRQAGACGSCFELTARGVGGKPPYAFEWEDGSHAAERVVCSGAGGEASTVRVQDADGHASAPYELRLEAADAACPAAPSGPLICLQNPSFEGKAAPNPGLPSTFDLSPWSACPASASNSPDVVDDTTGQMVVTLPKAVDGQTYLGLMEGEQASQELCRPLAVGSPVSLQLDVARIYIGGGLPDTELAFLELWGGVAAECSQRERLWASPAIGLQWQRHCVTLEPTQAADNLTLRARSDDTLGSSIYLVVDNLVPVHQCP
ncbi:MAG: hypothetical protein JWN48_3478 [Myxococcaceae bacterium]|nr:hypothetical protein [Myxococcaceae bacterium]